MTHRSQATPLDAATFIVSLLQEQGHVAYFAGGCVRDALLGLTPKDYDVATSATPQQVAGLFRQTQFVGEAFGVTLVRLKGQCVEVATFRKEWGYEDGRRPTQVVFTDAQEDAQRRDFTINGLFENPLAASPDERIIDHVGGVADLHQGILRAIGQPEERFAEDYLRMLRAVRFASRFGFTLETATRQAIQQHAAKLHAISPERIGMEVQAMLTPVHPDDKPSHRRSIALAARLLGELGLDGVVLNEAACPTLDLPTLAALEKQASPDADYPAALLAWLIDRQLPGKPANMSTSAWLIALGQRELREIIPRWRQSLVLSNAFSDALPATWQLMTRVIDWATLPMAGRKRLLGHPHWRRAQAVLHALSVQHCSIQAFTSQIEQDTPALVAQGLTPEPLLTGADLIALGQKPGPSFRRLLEQAYDAQLEGVFTHRDHALQWLKALIEQETR